MALAGWDVNVHEGAGCTCGLLMTWVMLWSGLGAGNVDATCSFGAWLGRWHRSCHALDTSPGGDRVDVEAGVVVVSALRSEGCPRK